MCGTEKFPEKFKAKKYKLHDHFIDKKNFHHMMTNLPEQVIIKLAFCILLSLHCCQVSEDDIEEMFKFADKDQDGKISFIEFQLMIKPQKPDESNNNYNLENLKNINKNGENVKKVTIMTENDSLAETNKDKDMLISI